MMPIKLFTIESEEGKKGQSVRHFLFAIARYLEMSISET